MHRRGWWLVAALLVSGPVDAAELRVAVAGNFVPALETLAADFEAAQGHRLRPIPGSTGKLYAQVVQGAPFDVFLAADADRPARLEAAGLGVAGTRVTYAIGRLALWAPDAEHPEQALQQLNGTPTPRVALANPRHAPYGTAAEAFLRGEGLWEKLGERLVRGENVAQAHHFVASGNAELGLVALPQLRLQGDRTTGAVWVVPADRHPSIEQQALLIRESPAGRSFLAWLLSEPVQARLREFGYDSP
jgi:molybdate transport system substrate-binding protein